MRHAWVLLFASTVLVVPFFVFGQTAAEERRKALEEELKKVEQEIQIQAALLNNKRQETSSIQRDVSILTTQINKAQLEIKSKNLSINNITKDIGSKLNTIKSLEEEIEDRQGYLRKLLQSSHELDTTTLPEIILGHEKFSDFFGSEETLVSIQGEVKVSMDVIRGVKQQTEEERKNLEEKKVAEASAKLEIELKKKEVEQSEAQKKSLLAVSQTQERAYAAVLADRQRKAAEIRAALFALRDTSAIPFGRALEYAQLAEKRTGVRPAFLLAILTQESNLGQNIGTCNRPGDPPEKHWREIMPGPGESSWRDDETIFLQLMKELGRDPDSTPLSCPYKGGWGGAMGPAQFIPTTWNSYKAKISAATGNNPPDPWNPEDAFMASSIYLSELGAGQKTFAAEREAALRYYAGSNWSKPANAFYGDSVMGIAANIQTTMIEPLQGL